MNKKVLIIRFNSIGDVVLTTPVIEALAKNGYEVHYLAKSAFSILLKPNPNVEKVWEFKGDLDSIISDLKNEEFDLVIDLHNNYRSSKVKRALKKESLTFKKPRIKYFLLTKLGINVKPEPHIVRRFLNVIRPIVGEVDHPKMSFYFESPSDTFTKLILPSKFIVIAVGTAFQTKTIPIHKLVAFIQGLSKKVVLIGGDDDLNRSHTIQENCKAELMNLVGKLSISDSARLIEKSELLVSGDTGMMHIGAALNVPMLNIFGSTHPILGYTPFYGKDENKSVIVENNNLRCRPCTKQGQNKCPKGHFKCMNDISVDQMLKVIQ